MEEYEYSFKVNDIKPYIDYCQKENYEKIEESSQIRVIYKNVNKIRARITTQEKNGKKKVILDFKKDYQSNGTLNVSKETLPLEVNNKNKEAIDSILEILGYRKDKTLIRKRIVYYKKNVTFELDDYSSPEVMFVAAIEGKKEKVDKIYKELKEKINNEISG